MNKSVTEAHAMYREKVKSEKSLKAVKRKLSDDVFKQSDFGLEGALRFKKSYCQEVTERAQKKKKDETEPEIENSDATIQDILTKDKTAISHMVRLDYLLNKR